MGVEFTCPTCGQSAVIVKDGFVREHRASTGEICTFTRTARSGTRPRFIPPDERTQRRIDAARAEAEARARKAEEQPQPVASKPPAAPKWGRCDTCGARVRMRGDGKLRAHASVSSSRWCKGGAEPTAKQLKSKRSVWTISGGLPSLGKR